MTRECRRHTCSNDRRDRLGTAGQYCSDECMRDDRREANESLQEAADALAQSIVDDLDSESDDR